MMFVIGYRENGNTFIMNVSSGSLANLGMDKIAKYYSWEDMEKLNESNQITVNKTILKKILSLFGEKNPTPIIRRKGLKAKTEYFLEEGDIVALVSNYGAYKISSAIISKEIKTNGKILWDWCFEGEYFVLNKIENF